MTAFYHDPHRPHIDGAELRCPECGQSYDAIVEGFVSLPHRHYRQPTNTFSRRASVGVANSSGKSSDRWLCPTIGDDLVQHLFRAQLAAERQQREAAA